VPEVVGDLLGRQPGLVEPGGHRRAEHVRWLDALRSAVLYACRPPAAPLLPHGLPRPHAWVSTDAVRPLGEPQRVPDLLGLQEGGGPVASAVDPVAVLGRRYETGLDVSGIRPRNAQPRLDTSARRWTIGCRDEPPALSVRCSCRDPPTDRTTDRAAEPDLSAASSRPVGLPPRASRWAQARATPLRVPAESCGAGRDQWR
jgi:hypothetical protein